VVWRTAPVQSIEQAKRAELVLAAAQGPGTGSNVVMALNALVGTRIALVKGYKSVSESGLAMERNVLPRTIQFWAACALMPLK